MEFYSSSRVKKVSLQWRLMKSLSSSSMRAFRGKEVTSFEMSKPKIGEDVVYMEVR